MDQTPWTVGFAGAGVALSLWLAGAMRDLPAYRVVRACLGRFSEKAGHGLSVWGNTVYRGLWEPFEAVFVDFFLFMAEQFAAGMRRDNPERIRAQIDRLEEVGSKVRVKALRGTLKTGAPRARAKAAVRAKPRDAGSPRRFRDES